MIPRTIIYKSFEGEKWKLPKVNAGFLVKAFELPTGSKKTVMYSPSITKGELWDVLFGGRSCRRSNIRRRYLLL